MMVLLSLISGTTIMAQFNTVGRLDNHQVHKTKNPQEINSSLVDSLILNAYVTYFPNLFYGLYEYLTARIEKWCVQDYIRWKVK